MNLYQSFFFYIGYAIGAGLMVWLLLVLPGRALFRAFSRQGAKR